jgi:hypothetical protein
VRVQLEPGEAFVVGLGENCQDAGVAAVLLRLENFPRRLLVPRGNDHQASLPFSEYIHGCGDAALLNRIFEGCRQGIERAVHVGEDRVPRSFLLRGIGPSEHESSILLRRESKAGGAAALPQSKLQSLAVLKHHLCARSGDQLFYLARIGEAEPTKLGAAIVRVSERYQPSHSLLKAHLQQFLWHHAVAPRANTFTSWVWGLQEGAAETANHASQPHTSSRAAFAPHRSPTTTIGDEKAK